MKLITIALSFTLLSCSYHVDKMPLDTQDTSLAKANLGFSLVRTSILGPKCMSCHEHPHSWMSSYALVLNHLGEMSELLQSSDPATMMPKPPVTITADEKAGLLHWIAQGGPENPGQIPAPITPPITPPTPPPPPGPVPPTLSFAYVKQEVLEKKCITCHHHATDWATYADIVPDLQDIKVRVNSATGAEGHMPRPSAPQLSAEELGLLNQWLDAGAQETGPAIPPIHLSPTPTPAPTPVPGPDPSPAPGPIPDPSPSPRIGFAQVKAQIFDQKCVICHHHATNLKDYPSVRAELPDMKSRLHAAASADEHMPPISKPQLNPDELALLDAWLDQGALEN